MHNDCVSIGEITFSQSRAIYSGRFMSHFIVFTKYPDAGHAKTRLIPAVGPARAAEISRTLTERCLRTVRTICSLQGATLSVYYAVSSAERGNSGEDIEEKEKELVERWLGCRENEEFVRQREGDLGLRLDEAFRRTFSTAMTENTLQPPRVIVLGTDIPEISEHILCQALAALDKNEVVIGPAADGGYYLLGMREYHPEIFNSVRWSTQWTLSDTMRNIGLLNLSVSKLRTLRDIDIPEDLPYFEKICKHD